MMTAAIDIQLCDRSPGCPARRVCPRGAISPIPGPDEGRIAGYIVDTSRCTGCGVCVRVCPTGAVRMDILASVQTADRGVVV